MTIPLHAPLPTAGAGDASGKLKKFTDIAPGSAISVVDITNPARPPLEGVVLDVQAEYGPTGVPALQLLAKDYDEPFIIVASGRYSVTVVSDAAQLARSVGKVEGVVAVRTIPRPGEALRFTGGPASAADCIRWSIGTGVLRYVQASADSAEHLITAGVNPDRIYPGAWIVKQGGKIHVLDDRSFAAEYEEAS